MKFRRHIFLPGIFLLVTVACGYLLHVLYKEAREVYYGKSVDSFLLAINNEKEIRMDRSHTFFSHTRKETASDSIVLKGEQESIVLEKPDSVKNMAFHEKQNHMEQSYLFMAGKHTKIHVLDSLWRMELLKNKISAPTAVLYRNNITGENCLSRDDSLFYVSAGQMPEIKLGIRGEITLQGFVRISSFTVMAANIEKSAWIIIVWLIVAGSAAFLAFHKKRKTSATIPAEEEFRLGEYISLDTNHQTLIYQHQKIQLTKQSFQLFEFLWNQTDHFANYEEMTYFLYNIRNLDKTDNRLFQSVRRLRKSLEEIPEVKVENIQNKGYQIVLGL